MLVARVVREPRARCGPRASPSRSNSTRWPWCSWSKTIPLDTGRVKQQLLAAGVANEAEASIANQALD